MAYNPNNPNGQGTSANSAPVVIASDQSAIAVNVTSSVEVEVKNDTGNPIPVSAASLPLPSGAATSANQQTNALTDAQLRAIAVPVTNASLPLPTGAATSANQATEIASLSSVDTKTPALGQALAAASTPVVLTAAQVTTLTPQTNALTDTQLRATAVPVSNASLPLPSGASTSALQTTGNTSISSIDTKLSSQATAANQTTGNTSISSIDTKTPALGQALAAASVPIVLTAAQVTALTPPAAITGYALDSTVAKDASLTTLNTSVNTLLKPANTLAAVTTVGTVTAVTAITNALPAGTNILGKVSIDQTTPGTTNLVQIGGTIPAVSDITNTGTLAALNATLALSVVNGYSGTVIQITGTWVGTIQFEGTLDNTNWSTINGIYSGTSAPAPTVTTNGVVRLTPAGLSQIRVNMTAYTSGTATITMRASQGAGGTFLNQSLTVGTNVIGKVGIDQTTPGTTNAVSVTNASIPVTGAFFQSTQPVSIATMPTTPVTGTFFQATQPVSGTITSNIGTTNGLALDATLTGGTLKSLLRGSAKGTTVAGDITSTNVDANTQAVDVSVKGTVATTLSGTPSVSVSNFPATQPVSIATNTPDVTDRVGRLLGQVTNAGTFAVQSAATLQAGSAIAGKFGIDQTTPGTTNKVSIGVDGTVAINTALPTGANIIGAVTGTTSNNSADVTMQNAAVAIGNGTVLNSIGYGTSVLLVSGTFIGTVIFEQSPDNGTTWGNIVATIVGGADETTSTTTTGTFRLAVTGLTQIRARISAYTSGSITVVGRVTNATISSKIVGLATGTKVIGSLTANQSVNTAQVNGVAPLMGNGVTGTGSQRVTIASDNTAFAVNAATTQVDTSISGTISATDILAAAPAGGGVLISTTPTASSFVAALVPGGTAQADIQITGTATGTYYFEASMDSTTGSDGNWIATNYRQTGISNTVLGYSTTTVGVYRGAPSGFKYIRVRNVGGSTPNNPVIFRYSNGSGTTFLNASIPAGTNIIGKFGIDQTTPGTTNLVALAANQSINTAQINGITPLMGNGVTGTGSQRVTIASDNTAFSVNATLSAETTKVIGTVNIAAAQTLATVTTVTAVTAITNALPAGTNLMGKVGIDQTTVGTTNAISLAQIGVTTIATGNGVVSAGVQRVSIASDNTAFSVNATLQTGANVIGALTANQSVNTAQINGVAPSMGAGATGTGVQRVILATDNLPTASASADALANPTVSRIDTTGLTFNGTSWDRIRGMSVATTTGDTGAKVATGNGATQTNVGNKGIQVFIVLGTVSGTTPTAVFKMQGSVDGGTNFYDIPGATTASLTASTNVGITLFPGIAVTAGSTTTGTTAGANGVLPRTWRMIWTIGGTTPSFTITSITYNYLPY